MSEPDQFVSVQVVAPTDIVRAQAPSVADIVSAQVPAFLGDGWALDFSDPDHGALYLLLLS